MYCRSSWLFDDLSAALAFCRSWMSRAFSAVAAIWSATVRIRWRVSSVTALADAK